jgi:hypothetical protein
LFQFRDCFDNSPVLEPRGNRKASIFQAHDVAWEPARRDADCPPLFDTISAGLKTPAAILLFDGEASDARAERVAF